jgi:hypothetical protein
MPEPRDPEPPAPAEPPPGPSWGNMSERHWSRSRRGQNREAIDHYQQRSKAPGVAEGGAERNHYCLQCDGVIPLRYDSRVPLEQQLPELCPHCGAALEGRVRAMFNWVEIDQVSGSDARAVLPFVALGLLLIGLLGVLAWWLWA